MFIPILEYVDTCEKVFNFSPTPHTNN